MKTKGRYSAALIRGFLMFLARSAFGDWQSVGSMIPSAPEDNQITFHSRQATATITV